LKEVIMMANVTPGWLELNDLTFHQQSEAVSPKGLNIKGDLGEKNSFMPTSGIEGKAFADTPSEGITSGWVELNGLRFISDVTAVAPVEPYVKGLQDEDGNFYPDKPYTIVGRSED
jgi:hypothetical protein